jgi:hypothetical protein
VLNRCQVTSRSTGPIHGPEFEGFGEEYIALEGRSIFNHVMFVDTAANFSDPANKILQNRKPRAKQRHNQHMPSHLSFQKEKSRHLHLQLSLVQYVVKLHFHLYLIYSNQS